MIDVHFLYKDLIKDITERAPFEPDLAIVLGSGLGNFAQSLRIVKSISSKELVQFPESTVQGHEGKLHFAEYHNKKILLFQGRIHFYEGYNLSQCVLPVHIAASMRVKKILLTNAAGGINPRLKPGSLMLNSSFVGTGLKKELTDLIGLGSLEKRNSFLDFPSKAFNSLTKDAAIKEKIKLEEGVYWYTKGPSYETPSEIKMISMFGGDAVGMSTVHEAIYAAYRGIETASISCITNYAAGITSAKLSHNDVTETAQRVRTTFEALLKRIIMMV